MSSTAFMDMNSGVWSSKYRLFITRSRALPLVPSSSGVDSARDISCRSLSLSSSSNANGRTAIRVTQATSVAVRAL